MLRLLQGGGVGDELKTFRCRMRTGGRTVLVDCLAPTSWDAAWVVAAEAMKDDPAPWLQVVVSRWIVSIGRFVEPANAIMVTRADPPPPGAARVVLGFVPSDSEVAD